MRKYADLSKAVMIAATEFEGDFDKGGSPYIMHLIRVMESMDRYDYKGKIVGVLHDLMEDKPDWTPARLLDEGFNPIVVAALVLLTHLPHASYDEYIEGIKGHQLATRVKLADLRDNSDITRLKGVTQKDLDRLAKYAKVYTYLINE